MEPRVKIHSVKVTDDAFIVVMVAEHVPDAAVAVTISNGNLTENVIADRFRHAFRALKNGIEADGKNVAA